MTEYKNEQKYIEMYADRISGTNKRQKRTKKNGHKDDDAKSALSSCYKMFFFAVFFHNRRNV